MVVPLYVTSKEVSSGDRCSMMLCADTLLQEEID